MTYIAYKHVREFILIREARRRQRLAKWQQEAQLEEDKRVGFEVTVTSIERMG